MQRLVDIVSVTKKRSDMNIDIWMFISIMLILALIYEIRDKTITTKTERFVDDIELTQESLDKLVDIIIKELKKRKVI